MSGLRPSKPESYDNQPELPGKTRILDLDYTLAATLAYIPLFPFNVIISLMWVVTEQNSRNLRFNAMQSLALSAVFIAISVVIGLLSVVFLFIPFLMPLIHATYVATFVVYVVFSVIAMRNAYAGKPYKIPYLGNLVQQYV